MAGILDGQDTVALLLKRRGTTGTIKSWVMLIKGSAMAWQAYLMVVSGGHGGQQGHDRHFLELSQGDMRLSNNGKSHAVAVKAQTHRRHT